MALGFGQRVAQAEAVVKEGAHAALKGDVEAVQGMLSSLPPIDTVEGLKGLLQDIAALQKEKPVRGKRAAGPLKNLATVRDRFFRELANNQTRFRALVNARDELIRQFNESKSRANREARTGANVERDFSRKMANLEKEASALVGSRVSADEFESLVTRTRRLTAEERVFLDAAEQDARAIQSELKPLVRANRAAIAQVKRAIAALEKFAGVQGARVGNVDVSATLQNAASNALNKLRSFLQDLEREQSTLLLAMGQIDSLIEASKNTISLEDVESWAAVFSNFSLVAAGVGIVIGAAASPVTGVLLLIGLILRVVNKLVSEVNIARKLFK